MVRLPLRDRVPLSANKSGSVSSLPNLDLSMTGESKLSSMAMSSANTFNTRMLVSSQGPVWIMAKHFAPLCRQLETNSWLMAATQSPKSFQKVSTRLIQLLKLTFSPLLDPSMFNLNMEWTTLGTQPINYS